MVFAKTTRPRVVSAMPRPRLHRLLGRRRTPSVTWVWGPPGAGKTTVVSSFVSACRLRELWYQVDASDADVATFFYFLGLAAPRRSRPLPLFTPEYRPGLEVFARRFLRELYKRFDAPFVFVLDNYHDAPADALLHEVVRVAAEELPESGRLIVISRMRPPAALARLRVHQSIDVVDWAHLRLTASEAATLTRRALRQRHSMALARTLYKRSDGWIAGLMLLLNQPAGEDQSPSRHRASPQVLFDYFAAEIFNRADPHTREVLLQTAFLPVVDPKMAVELTGIVDAADVIKTLHRANSFTSKRSGSDGAYEYHPLFREFLRAEARRLYAPPRLAALQTEAATLVEHAGDVAAAADLLAEAENWEPMAQLICRHAPALLAQGRVWTVEQWLTRMPESAYASEPWLSCWRGVCQLGRDHESCRRDCEEALAALRARGDTAGALLAWSVIVTSYLMEGHVEPLDTWIPVLEQLKAEHPEPLPPHIEARVATTMIVGIAFRQPRHPHGPIWAERALAATENRADLSLRALAAFGWFLYYWTLGDTTKAALVIDEMRALSRRRDVASIIALYAAVPVVWYECFDARPMCRQTVTEIREYARTTGLCHALSTSVLTYGTFSALSDGDLDLTSAWLRDLRIESAALGPTYSFAYHGLEALAALAHDDVERASIHLEELARRGYTTGYPLEKAFAKTIAAYLYSRRAEDDRALLHVQDGLDFAIAERIRLGEWFVRLAQAHVLFGAGADAEGLRALAAAMTLGKASGYVSSQVWLPTMMAPLCARALDAGIEVDYVRDLIRRRGLVCDPPPLDVEAWPWPIRVSVLGRFAVLKDDRPLRSVGKEQRKPLAVLKTLAAHGARGLPARRIMDALWPDAEGDASRRALTTAVYRLRRLLDDELAVVRGDGRIALNASRCWVDVWALERLLDRSERASMREDIEGAAHLVERAAALYGGPIVGAYDDDMSTNAAADALRRRLLRQLVATGRWYETAEQWQRAADVFETALKVDPCAEAVYAALMTAYHRLGRSADVDAVYERCRQTLERQVGARPSARTEAVRAALRSP